jgi:hypothetical protein
MTTVSSPPTLQCEGCGKRRKFRSWTRLLRLGWSVFLGRGTCQCAHCQLREERASQPQSRRR